MKKSRRSHTIKKCKYCKDGTGYATVQISDIPEELRGLNNNVIWSLRPLEPWTGARYGRSTVTESIKQIKELASAGLRQRAQETYYLMICESSAYKRFVDRDFLHKHKDNLTGDADDQLLQLPRRCLEKVGIECAVTPQPSDQHVRDACSRFR